MKILVLNCGSSSIKFRLYHMPGEDLLVQGLIENIGDKLSTISYKIYKKNKLKFDEKENKQIINHDTGINRILDLLLDYRYNIIKDYREIDAIGHRVVHGGEEYSKPVILDDHVQSTIKNCYEMAPLHNPANYAGIEATLNVFSQDTKHVVVFDTAYHQSLSPEAFLYPLPMSYYKKYGVRKYGFHGISHQYLVSEAARLLARPESDMKIICCHLGNGASITAVDKGVSVDTSMGMTPLEGLMMGTRSGDLDPGIIMHMMQTHHLSVNEISRILNQESGLLAISEISNDLRDIEQAVAQGNSRALLAMKMYTRRIVKYIGAYAALMNGLDLIIFSAGVGENSSLVREKVVENLGYLGVKLDTKLNLHINKERPIISTIDSKIKIMVIPTNEEIMIARECYSLLN